MFHPRCQPPDVGASNRIALQHKQTPTRALFVLSDLFIMLISADAGIFESSQRAARENNLSMRRPLVTFSCFGV